VNPMITQHEESLADICRRFGVLKLDVFGSAAGEDFDPERSDLDFLVEFGDVPGGDRFSAYFGLKRALEQLFRRRVDLVEAGAPRNPYFIRRLNESRRPVFAA